MSEILARFVPNRGLMAGMFAGFALFSAAAISALVNAGSADLGEAALVTRASLWIIIILCPVYAVDILLRIIRRTPTLVATSEGIRLRSILGYTDPIKWSEIEGFGPEVISKKLWLAIYLCDPRNTLARFGLLTRLLHVRTHDEGGPNITLRRFQIGTDPIEAAELLTKIIAKQKDSRRDSSS